MNQRSIYLSQWGASNYLYNDIYVGQLYHSLKKLSSHQHANTLSGARIGWSLVFSVFPDLFHNKTKWGTNFIQKWRFHSKVKVIDSPMGSLIILTFFLFMVFDKHIFFLALKCWLFVLLHIWQDFWLTTVSATLFPD